LRHGDDWTMYLGDSAQRMAAIADNSVGLSIFSPPFMSLYTYSPTERDSATAARRRSSSSTLPTSSTTCSDHHAGPQLRCPCRRMCRDAGTRRYYRLKDFPGETIGLRAPRLICMAASPSTRIQVQASDQSKGLVFQQLEKDSAWSAPAIADQILLFASPRELVPVHLM